MSGILLTAVVPNGGTHSVLNVSSATVVSPRPTKYIQLIVNTAGSTVGSVSDCTAVADVAASNLVFSIPNTVGLYTMAWPFLIGVTVTPGTGQVLSVSYL